MRNNYSLSTVLRNLRGNPRYCVLTEPLWGIPFNLYMPYASLYMAAFGITDSMIGFIASLGMFFQVFFALLSGVITDKLGRKRTTVIFDTLSWSVPCLIWAIAQNFTYFAVAAMVNSMWRVTMNSWTCLLVEDCEEDQLVSVYALIHIAGLLAAFFAPLAGLFVGWHGLIPTVRALYIIAFIMMTSKFIILNLFAEETKQGVIRMAETREQSIVQLLGQYGGVIRQILGAPQTILALGILLVMNSSQLIISTFWPLMVTERLAVPLAFVSIFPFLRSLAMLFMYLVVVPRLSPYHFRNPMLCGFVAFILSQLLLVTAPVQGYLFLIISIALEAGALALINPLLDSMLVIAVDRAERARIMAILHVAVIVCTSPFGWVAGILSERNQAWPFVLNIILFMGGLILTHGAGLVLSRRLPKTAGGV